MHLYIFQTSAFKICFVFFFIFVLVYRMSFSQPLSEVIEEPADDWKLILASTFTAMGLMTLGLYIWMARNGIQFFLDIE